MEPVDGATSSGVACRTPSMCTRNDCPCRIQVGITERAVQRIVADLEAGGYLTRHRAGRLQMDFAVVRAPAAG